jgi:uncharacterized protein (TIGR02594 family)
MNSTEACKRLHDFARAELGVHETPGPESTARIVEYAKHTTLRAKSDDVPWCSSFANFVTDTAGFPGTGSAAARSWLKWGVKLDAPVLGCVVVLKRGKAPAGHVTFCDHPDVSNGIVRCIGGNQGNAVKVSRFPVADVLGYRSPV